MKHRRHPERGLPDSQDVYQAGTFCLQVTPGERVTIVLSSEPQLQAEFGGSQHEVAVEKAWTRHQQRVQQLLATANQSKDALPQRDPVLASLILPVDQFIVARPARARDSKPDSEQ